MHLCDNCSQKLEGEAPEIGSLSAGSAFPGQASGDRIVRMAVTRTSKMLRAARTAGLVKLQRGIGCVDQWRLWTVSIGWRGTMLHCLRGQQRALFNRCCASGEGLLTSANWSIMFLQN